MSVEIGMPQSGQLPQVKNSAMNDRDFLNDQLFCEKSMTVGYNIGLNEMQNPMLYNDIQRILNNTHLMQQELFNLMFQKGWYKMKAAESAEISQAYTQFSNYSTQFPKF